MANAGQFAQDADILLRVGANGSATVLAAGWFDTIILDVEAVINCLTRLDWSARDAAGTLTATKRKILIDTGASMAAIIGIMWDMSGYTSRSEAESMVTMLRDTVQRNLSILRDEKVKTFLKET